MEEMDEYIASVRKSLNLTPENTHRDIEEVPFWLPDNKRFTYGFIAKDLEEGKRLPKDERLVEIVYARAGNRLFLDDRLQDMIPDHQLKYDKKATMFVPFYYSPLGKERLVRYSLLTVAAVDHAGDKGRYFLDLGSADGILSLVANTYGFKTVSIDYDGSMESRLERNITLNGLDHDDFCFIHGRLEDFHLFHEVPEYPYDVVAANIGAHYGDADITAIEIAASIQTVHTFIGGGYIETYPGNDEEDIEKYDVKHAIKRLKLYGFSDFQMIKEKKFSDWRRVAFIAKRKI